ncbi:hypothetical protein BU16DRAFT_539023 [Lophium mytilinum]|uniref:SAM domain-containing protein n=1 Tax=Lophium mytilinum TaxID=390894 RepID=A0A6A6QWG6_9PEZI|nr:hypothetical protein BU16DRAFT_539023 [Lophium mytilinum]
MANLASKLQGLGLERYHVAFVENGFENWSTLSKITDDDLKELGVKMGHRRILQHEIAAERNKAAEELSSLQNGGALDETLGFREYTRRFLAEHVRVVPEDRLDILDSEEGNWQDFLGKYGLCPSLQVCKLFWEGRVNTYVAERNSTGGLINQSARTFYLFLKA